MIQCGVPAGMLISPFLTTCVVPPVMSLPRFSPGAPPSEGDLANHLAPKHQRRLPADHHDDVRSLLMHFMATRLGAGRNRDGMVAVTGNLLSCRPCRRRGRLRHRLWRLLLKLLARVVVERFV